jgi:hypothetical protein
VERYGEIEGRGRGFCASPEEALGERDVGVSFEDVAFFGEE